MPLDSKEVELKGRAILKASAAGDPSSTLLGIIDELHRGVVASEELLRSTKIGVTVNKLKQHKDPVVKQRASDLVSKWRSDIKKAPGSGSSTPRPNGVKTDSPAPGKGSPAPSAVKEKAKHTVPKEKRNAKEDKVNTNVTGNAVRDNCIKLLYDGLAFMSEDCELSVPLGRIVS